MAEVWFRCEWCGCRIQYPAESAPIQPTRGFRNALDEPLPPEPWAFFAHIARLGRPYYRTCCPDCFEHYFPPRILSATET